MTNKVTATRLRIFYFPKLFSDLRTSVSGEGGEAITIQSGSFQ